MNRFEEWWNAETEALDINTWHPHTEAQKAWNAALASQWRPMSELPEKDGWYLVWSKAASTWYGNFYGVGAWDYEATTPDLADDYTHWMEVPKP